MQEIELTWTWVLEDPLHIGSGLSDPGRADRLVQRGPRGEAVIPGDAVKGALRMSAEQLAVWLGTPQRYTLVGPVEPVSPLFQALFGGEGSHHYEPARTESGTKATFMVVASTAIVADSETAMANSLRKVEIVAPGVRFAGRARVWLNDESEFVAQAATLLTASLAATESVGGKGGTGWGRCRLEDVRLKAAGREERVTEVCSRERLEGLKPGLAKGLYRSKDHGEAPKGLPAVAGKDLSGRGLAWYRLEIRLQEPATIGASPLVSNQIATRDHISGSVLRGALRQAWLREGRNADEIDEALCPSTRWTPALPMAEGGGVLVPTPLSFVTPKDVAVSRTTDGCDCHDALLGDPPEAGRDGVPLRWAAATTRWIAPLGATGSPARVRRQLAMHVGLDYGAGAHRPGALYSMDAIAPCDGTESSRFVAFVQLPRQMEFPKELFLGKRTTAGSGRAVLVASGADSPARIFPRRPVGDDDRTLFVQLLSPALVRGVSGHWLRTIPWCRWLEEAGLTARPGEVIELGECRARASATSIPGWMGPWGHGRAPVTAVDAGSAYRLVFRTKELAEAARKALQDLEEIGVGERTHEGFGWFVVDPAWLGVLRIDSSRISRAPGIPLDPAGERLSWPGCEGLDASALQQIVCRASPLRDATVLKRQLRILLRQTTGSGASPEAVLAYARAMAARVNPGAWASFASNQPLERFLRLLPETHEAAPLAALRFGLEVLLIQAGRSTGGDS